jgi:hypothetical protein
MLAYSPHGELLWNYDHPLNANPPAGLVLSPDGARAYVTGAGGAAFSAVYWDTVALNVADGTLVWEEKRHETKPCGFTITAPFIYNPIVVSPDGKHLVVTGVVPDPNLSCLPAFGLSTAVETVSYDPETGAEQWVSNFDSPGYQAGNANATSFDGASFPVVTMNNSDAFVAVGDNSLGMDVWALDAATGAEKWFYTQPGSHTAARDITIAPDGSAIYVGGFQGSDTVVLAFDATKPPEPTPTPSASPSTTPTPTSTPTPSPTATPSATVSPSPSPSTTATASPSSTPSASPTPTPARLLNISTRVSVHTGDNVAIAGFIVRGNSAKRVIVRALGPSLQSNNQPVDGRMSDPTLELHDQNGIIAFNDNWKESQQSEIESTKLAPPDERESAIVLTLDPGAYTAVLRGKQNTTGVALVEIYDLDNPADSLLLNISTRGAVETGDKVMIGGFIAGDQNGSTRVLIRALGPSLRNQVASALDDPMLELHDQNGATIATNDNWRDSQENEIRQTGLAPGSDAESAILTDLMPANYTAVVQGKSGGTGIGLVEAYNLR